MKIIQTMNELLALPDCAILEISLPMLHATESDRRRHIMLVVDWSARKDPLGCLMLGKTTNQPRFVAFPEVGEYRISYDGRLNGVFQTELIHRRRVVGKNAVVTVSLFEAEDLRQFINRVGHAVARVKAIAADFRSME